MDISAPQSQYKQGTSPAISVDYGLQRMPEKSAIALPIITPEMDESLTDSRAKEKFIVEEHVEHSVNGDSCLRQRR